jgi:hypothetical protein
VLTDRAPAPTSEGVVRRRSVLWAVAFGAMAVVPFVVALVSSVGRAWVPAGDWAMIELATGDVGTTLTPLLGPYSRFGWNHPGPLLFWLLAGPYRVTGMAPWSLLATAAAINAVAAGAMVAFAWRNGRLVLAALVSLVTVAVTASSAGTMAADPWNPWITVMPFALLVVLAWAAWEGDRAALWWAVVVASFLAQSHVGYLPVAVVLLALGAVGAWRGGVPVRALRYPALLGVVLWLPPLLDLVIGRGNLFELFTGFSAGEDVSGGSGALELVARQLSWGGPWMGGGEPSDPVTGAVVGRPVDTLVLPVALFAWSLSMALWRRCTSPARLQIAVGVAAAVGVVSVARIDGPAFDYIVRWWWPLAGLWWVSSLWSLWEALIRPALEPRLAQRVGERAAPFLVGGLAALALVVGLPVMAGAVVAVTERATPSAPLPQAAVEIVAATRAAVAEQRGDGERPMVVLHAVGAESGWYADALGARLSADGVDVGAIDAGVNAGKWGQARLVAPGIADRSDPGRIDVWVVTGPLVDDLPADLRAGLRTGEVVVAYDRDPLDADQRDRRTEAEARIFAQLEAAGRSDLVRQYLEGGSVLGGRTVAGVDVDLLDRLRGSRQSSNQIRVYVVS